jgi:hypothetical protein
LRLSAVGGIESSLGAPAVAAMRRTHGLMAVRTQKRLAPAQGALPWEKTQKRQYFALHKTYPVEPSKFFRVTAAALLLHRLQQLQ